MHLDYLRFFINSCRMIMHLHCGPDLQNSYKIELSVCRVQQSWCYWLWSWHTRIKTGRDNEELRWGGERDKEKRRGIQTECVRKRWYTHTVVKYFSVEPTHLLNIQLSCYSQKTEYQGKWGFGQLGNRSRKTLTSFPKSLRFNECPPSNVSILLVKVNSLTWISGQSQLCI